MIFEGVAHMSPVIRISDELYKKLEKLAVGFDTPTSVIERLVNVHGSTNMPEEVWVKSKKPKDQKKPELIFYPNDENIFKSLLIKHKKASVVLYTKEGKSENHVWRASRIKASSNLRGNIWSGYLRDWKERGITKAEFSVENG